MLLFKTQLAEGLEHPHVYECLAKQLNACLLLKWVVLVSSRMSSSVQMLGWHQTFLADCPQ